MLLSEDRVAQRLTTLMNKRKLCSPPGQSVAVTISTEVYSKNPNPRIRARHTNALNLNAKVSKLQFPAPNFKHCKSFKFSIKVRKGLAELDPDYLI